MRRMLLTALFVVSLFLLFTNAVGAKALVFSVHPYLSSIELKKRFQPLVEELSLQTGYQISFRVSKNYESHVADLCSGQTDIAFIGPAVYVTAAALNPKIKLLGVLNGEIPFLRGIIVVRTDSTIKRPADLEGRSVAFVSPESTMGFKLACYTLSNAGVSLHDLGSYAFLGNHENVAFSVLAGKFDAGAIKQEVYEKNAGQGLRGIVSLPAVADHPFVASSQLAPDACHKIKDVLLHLDQTESGRNILHALRADAVAIRPVTDEEYDPLRLCTECLSTLEKDKSNER